MTRDQLVSIMLARNMSLDQAQAYLEMHGASTLYARNRRDSIIIWALLHGKDIDEVNRLCVKYEVRTIDE